MAWRGRPAWRTPCGAGGRGLWPAATDADSRAPGRLRGQAQHAARVTQVLVGAVAGRDGVPWPEPVRRAYELPYRSVLTATNSRRTGRASAGFAAHLAAVADEVSAG